MGILNGDEFSNIIEIAKDARNKMLNKNNYNKSKDYSLGSPDVFADGDEKGREDNGSGVVGNSIDNENRNKMLAKNLYTKSKQYKRPVD